MKNLKIKMKSFIRSTLQKILGFSNYLFLFSLIKIDSVKRKRYEEELLFFLSLIPDKGIILDIGANIGITMVPIAKELKNAEVHAYEPIQENCNNLQKVVKWFKLKNIKLFNIALGNGSGNLQMIMPIEGNSKMQGLSKVYDPAANEKGIIYNVPMKELDSIYVDHTNITAIKIDVENFEYEVLISGKQLLTNNHPLIYCELWNNEKRLMVYEYLKSLNYSVYIFNKDSLLAVEDIGKCKDNNFFFIHHQ